jgi:hypothetical protein
MRPNSVVIAPSARRWARKFDGDPTAWKIVDGKLYLNLNTDIQKKWLENSRWLHSRRQITIGR